jgi:hypothetical protein
MVKREQFCTFEHHTAPFFQNRECTRAVSSDAPRLRNLLNNVVAGQMALRHRDCGPMASDTNYLVFITAGPASVLRLAHKIDQGMMYRPEDRCECAEKASVAAVGPFYYATSSDSAGDCGRTGVFASGPAAATHGA